MKNPRWPTVQDLVWNENENIMQRRKKKMRSRSPPRRVSFRDHFQTKSASFIAARVIGARVPTTRHYYILRSTLLEMGYIY